MHRLSARILTTVKSAQGFKPGFCQRGFGGASHPQWNIRFKLFGTGANDLQADILTCNCISHTSPQL